VTAKVGFNREGFNSRTTVSIAHLLTGQVIRCDGLNGLQISEVVVDVGDVFDNQLGVLLVTL
jgi:hypothetical protein